MKKQEFIEALRNKLSILDKSEIEDILQEYTDTIDQKMSEGESEEKAVEDFGNIDELAKEILSAYKINDEFFKSSNKRIDPILQQVADMISMFVEKAIAFLTDFFDEMTAEGVAKIISTLLIALITLFFMRIPFAIIEGLGSLILAIVLPNFLEGLFQWAWSLVCNLGYLLFAIYFIVDVVKKKKISFSKKEDTTPKKTVKSRILDEQEEQTENLKDSEPILHQDYQDDFDEDDFEYEDDVVKEESKKKESVKKGIFSSTIIGLIKFMIAIFLSPFVMGNIALCCVVGILGYLAFTGAHVWGLFFLFIAIVGFVSAFIDLIWSLTQSKKKYKSILISAIVSGVILGVGTITFINEFSNYTTTAFPVDSLGIPTSTQTFTTTFEKGDDFHSGATTIEFVIDNSMKEGEAELSIVAPTVMQYTINTSEGNLSINNIQYSKTADDAKILVKLTKTFISGLKKDILYYYDFPASCSIRLSEKTKSNLTEVNGVYYYQ